MREKNEPDGLVRESNNEIKALINSPPFLRIGLGTRNALPDFMVAWALGGWVWLLWQVTDEEADIFAKRLNLCVLSPVCQAAAGGPAVRFLPSRGPGELSRSN